MNLTINYQANETGKTLARELAGHEWCNNQNISIKGQDYCQIQLDDPGSNLKRIFNSPQAIKNSDDPGFMREIMNLNSFYYGLIEDEVINREYEVLICDLKIISIKMTTFSKGKEQSKLIKENQNPKMVQIAQRVCHIMGLDLALITLGLTGKRKYKIQKVNASPNLRTKDMEYLLKYLTHIYEIDKYGFKVEVKLGADPEFMLINSKTGKLVPASQFFPRDGLVGCDSIRVPNRQQRPIAELRPHPEASPELLIGNIKNALYKASEMAPYRNVKWVAGSQPLGGYSIGGHIHFSNLELNGALLRALDNYLGLPIFMIEEQNTAVKRRKKYGFLGDFRPKDYGGFEYRTPGSWLVSQKIATGVLCLAKIVGTHYLELTDNFLSKSEDQAAFYLGNSKYFKNDFVEIWNQIQRVSTYQRYEMELQVFADMILQGVKWDEKNDLRKTWKINFNNSMSYTGQNKISSHNTGSSFNDGTARTRPHRSVSSENYSRVTRIQASNTTSVSTSITPTASRRSSPAGNIVTSGQVRRTHRISR